MNFYTVVDALIAAPLSGETGRVWAPFAAEESAEPDIRLLWERCPPRFYGVQALEPDARGQILKNGASVLFADRDWTKLTLYTEAGETAEALDSANALLILSVYSYLVTRRTLLVHSSLVNYKGNGIMFLGPSGIGKTTQAELWNRYTGADILNGDMVFVREQADGFYGYGSPWHGSSPYYMNAKVKVKALVVLEQAPENSLRALSGFEVMQSLMDQVFLPHWYPEAMDAALDTMDALLTRLPVYHLACRPDEAAVRLLQKELNIG